jgi:hypothetical protein
MCVHLLCVWNNVLRPFHFQGIPFDKRSSGDNCHSRSKCSAPDRLCEQLRSLGVPISVKRLLVKNVGFPRGVKQAYYTTRCTLRCCICSLHCHCGLSDYSLKIVLILLFTQFACIFETSYDCLFYFVALPAI